VPEGTCILKYSEKRYPLGYSHYNGRVYVEICKPMKDLKEAVVKIAI
jgi:hypothetical protein